MDQLEHVLDRTNNLSSIASGVNLHHLHEVKPSRDNEFAATRTAGPYLWR